MLGWSISHVIGFENQFGVLVPFDVGVVYIRKKVFVENIIVLVPFDVGVVYITL